MTINRIVFFDYILRVEISFDIVNFSRLKKERKATTQQQHENKQYYTVSVERYKGNTAC